MAIFHFFTITPVTRHPQAKEHLQLVESTRAQERYHLVRRVGLALNEWAGAYG